MWPAYDGTSLVNDDEKVDDDDDDLAPSPAAIASRINSIDCSKAIGEYQHESRISRPRVMLGKMDWSKFILSMVMSDASIRWIPYSSRISVHWRVWACFKTGAWWTGKRAPTIKSPGMVATIRREPEWLVE